MKGRLLFLISLALLQNAPGRSQQPAPSQPDETALSTDSNAFSISLYGRFREEKGNLFFSPASIWTAVGMAYAGAGGNTAGEMANALHFTLPGDRLHPAIGSFLDRLNGNHAGYQLRVADALWADQALQLLPGYTRLTETDYRAGLRRVSFATAPDEARRTINGWVEQQTDGKIKDLLHSGTVDASTRLVLTNAIYFKANWQKKFENAATKDEDFHVSPSQSVTAQLMHREGAFSYFDGGTFQVLDIPYKAGELSMLVFLPKDAGGLPALEEGLTPARYQQSVAGLQHAPKVILTLPRFKTEQEFDLKGALMALGMKSAFDRRTADFSAMTGKRDLWISAAVHKAFIHVDEEGTEAAAATGFGLSAGMVVRPQAPPIVFRADHPFLYVIREDKSGAILFMGRVADPTK